MLAFSHDARPADWLVSAGDDPFSLLEFGPAGFDSYARVLFLADPEYAGQPEAEGAELPGNPTAIDVLEQTVEALLSLTTTPDEGYFCVWDSGVSEVPAEKQQHALVDIPHRRSFLIEGSLRELHNWHRDLGLNAYDRPSFIWPRDRAWCIAADVDSHWAGVGGSGEAITSLERHPSLHCVRALRSAEHPRYR